MLTKWLSAFLTFIAACSLISPANAQDRDYAVGQVWAYETAPGDKGSLIRIQQIDSIGPKDDPMIVYHISIIGIRVGSGAQEIVIPVPHAPVSQRTLDASVTELVKTDAAFPDHLEGLQIWEEDNGGVFTITIAEVANLVRQSIARQMELDVKN